jgi:hypothetical protein
MLAQTMSNTTATEPMSRRSMGRMEPTICSCKGTASRALSGLQDRRPEAGWRARPSRHSTARGVTPGCYLDDGSLVIGRTGGSLGARGSSNQTTAFSEMKTRRGARRRWCGCGRRSAAPFSHGSLRGTEMLVGEGVCDQGLRTVCAIVIRGTGGRRPARPPSRAELRADCGHVEIEATGRPTAIHPRLPSNRSRWHRSRRWTR